MSDYKYPRIPVTVNGKELAIWGVEHTREFFNCFKSLFEEFIGNNDCVVLEQPVGADFWETDFFFGDIGELVREQGKKMYQVDPVTWGNLLLDLVTIGIGGRLVYKGAKGSKSPEKISRRGFLKRLGQLAIGVPLVWGSWPTRLLQDYLTIAISVSYGVDDQLGYGTDDYRNIVIAEELDRICREVESVRKIGSIHGAAHSEAVYQYLISPEKRFKRLAYLPHDILGNTKIREYTPTDKGWELSRSF